ncbi:response regulator transcription factor [Aurantiacibacter suaedae]|uniref:response regulator transcription factor n=1 Tax=Aurantiacibacter suaedae TaxID=2545755 RepID=UPI0010F49C8D|nr:LuxR C-terminal-related transcriptional regulator [Aurantiacibacter suaedae]
MDNRITLHIVGGTSRTRAEQARLAFSLGHHAEVYADLDEMFDRPPRGGVIVACDDVLENGAEALLDKLGEQGIWVPLVAAKENPGVEEVVDAIQAGALDYMELPLTVEELGRMIAHLVSDAGRHAEARRRLIDARRRIGTLSKREREVLEWLSEGCSNKAIARELEISPRTVEIHRANMMDKLGAGHAAEAVRMRLDAGLEGVPHEAGPAGGQRLGEASEEPPRMPLERRIG